MYPSFLIMMESRTPRYRKLCRTAYELKSFGAFLLFGLIHLTKWQSHEYSYSVSLFISFRNLEPKNLLEAFPFGLSFPYFPIIIVFMTGFLVWSITSNIWFGNESLFFAVNPLVLYSTGLHEWLILNIPLLDFGISTTEVFLWFFTMLSGRF